MKYLIFFDIQKIVLAFMNYKLFPNETKYKTKYLLSLKPSLSHYVSIRSDSNNKYW